MRFRSTVSSKRRDEARVTGTCMTQSSVKRVGRVFRPWAAETPQDQCWALLDVLAMQRYVEPFPLLFFGDPQSDGHIDDFEDEVADHEAVDQGGEHALQLRDDASACPPSSAALANTPVSNAPKV